MLESRFHTVGQPSTKLERLLLRGRLVRGKSHFLNNLRKRLRADDGAVEPNAAAAFDVRRNNNFKLRTGASDQREVIGLSTGGRYRVLVSCSGMRVVDAAVPPP